MKQSDKSYKQGTASIPQKPQAPIVNLERIPADLKVIPRWVLWRYHLRDGKWTKPPLTASLTFAKEDSPDKHQSFEEVMRLYEQYHKDGKVDGIGISLSDEDDLIGLDCDNCIALEIDEEILWTKSGNAFCEYCEVNGLYLEKSPSGMGLRAFARGRLPQDMRLKAHVDIDGESSMWEVYQDRRYMTVTGVAVGSFEGNRIPQLSSDAMSQLQKYMGLRRATTSVGSKPINIEPVELSEHDIKSLEQLRESTPKLDALLNGDILDYRTPSDAEQALCNLLARSFPDPRVIRTIWLKYAPWRPKYEREETYLKPTIEKALISIESQGAQVFTNLGEEEPQNKLEAWETPEEIHPVSKPAPFPIDALPELMRNAVVEVAERIQAPMEMVVAHALTVLSTAVQGQYNVIRDTRFQGGNKLRSPVSLFLLTILDSGERKSTSSLFKGKLREHEKSLKASKAKEFAHYDAQQDAYSKKRDTLLAEIKRQTKAREDTSECERRLEELEQPKGPVIPKWSYEDMTMEGLLKSMKDWPVAVLETDEAGSIFGGYSMSSDHSMKTFAQLNKLWSGDRVKITRGDVTKEAELDGARLTVGLSLQPSVLQKFMDSQGEQAEGSGFLARFLISAPESLMGTRFFEQTRKAWFGLAAFNEKILKLLNQTVKTRTDRRRKPKVMTLTPEAMNIWIEYHNSVEAQIAEGGKYRDVKSTAAKSAENAARIAALFEILESSSSSQENKLEDIDFSEPEPVESGADTDSVDNEPEGPKVGKTQMIAGVRLAQWYLDEAQRYQTKVLVPKEIQNAWKLDAWLLRRCREKHVDYFPKNEVLQGGPGSMRKCEQLQAALNILKDHHRIQTVSKEPTSRKKVWIHLNPALIPNSQDLQ